MNPYIAASSSEMNNAILPDFNAALTYHATSNTVADAAMMYAGLNPVYSEIDNNSV